MGLNRQGAGFTPNLTISYPNVVGTRRVKIEFRHFDEGPLEFELEIYH